MADAELNMNGRFTVATMRGVAFWLRGYATRTTEEHYELACDITDYSHEHDDGCYLYSEPGEVEDRSMVLAVMVGDDYVHIVDVSDLTEISEHDYCSGCGQTGCTADVR